MNSDKQSGNASFVYASPLIFLAACGLLTVIIAVFAVNNYQREKKLVELGLKQEATAILNLVATGSRSAMRRGFMRGEFAAEEWLQSISQNIENSLEHPGLMALYLVDRNGVVKIHSNENLVGTIIAEQVGQLLGQLQKENQRRVSGFVKPADQDETFFMMAMRYFPAGMMDSAAQFSRGRMGRMHPERPPIPPEFMERMKQLDTSALVLVAELSLDNYRQAVRKQILQIVILSVILLLVGVGGLLSLILIQTYKGSQRRLRRMSTFTDTLVSSLPLGLIATSPEGVVRSCNPSAVQMLNLGDKNIIGRPFEEVLDDRVSEILKKYERQDIYHWEMDFPQVSGTPRNLNLTKLTIGDEEQQGAGQMLLLQDLSDIRGLEEQLQRAERDAVVGRMAAGVAHELRNPLSSVKGLALLLKSKLEGDVSAQQTADLMVEQVERLNRSISELLDYARPGFIQKTIVNIDELVRNAVMLIQADADIQNISIKEEYACGPQTLEGDRDKLTQVILNLCLNGIQAMNEGGVLVISTSCSDHWVTIKIADTGCGIQPEIKDRIFEPYFTTKHEGTGLGLAMSARIISDHDGTISLESEDQKGTTVEVRLPFR